MRYRRVPPAAVAVLCWSFGLAVAPTTAAPSYAVSLTASPTTLEVGEHTALTVTANQDLTGTRYITYLYDQTDPTWYRTCKVQSCAFSVTQTAPGTHTYIAYIARDRSSPRYPPMQIQATSETVSVTWTPTTFTVSLSADRNWLPPGATSTLVAEANRVVDGRGLAIQIYELTTGTRVASCTTGSTCSAAVTELLPSTRTFQAFVAAPATTPPPPDIRASSDVVAVTWSPLPDPTRPPNVGGGDLTAAVTFSGQGVPPVGAPCAPTSFTFAGASHSAWVNGSGTAYVGALVVEGEGGSTCEAASSGAGTVTVQAAGSNEVGEVACGPLQGTYTRTATDMTLVVTGDCVINDFPAFAVSFIAKGEALPTNDGGGSTAPVTEATFAGGFVVVPT